MIDWKRLGIAFGLALGLDHRLGPARSPATRRAALHPRGRGLPEEVKIIIAAFRRFAVGVAALLGFENEAAAFVRVDPPEIAGPVAIVLKHAALEDIIIRGVVGETAIRRVDANEQTKGVEEALSIGELGPARLSPMLDEGVELLIRDCRAIRTQHSPPLIEQTNLIALRARAIGGLKRVGSPPKYPARVRLPSRVRCRIFRWGCLGALDGSGRAPQRLPQASYYCRRKVSCTNFTF
jgi:hypothetical protein